MANLGAESVPQDAPIANEVFGFPANFGKLDFNYGRWSFDKYDVGYMGLGLAAVLLPLIISREGQKGNGVTGFIALLGAIDFMVAPYLLK